MNNIKNEHNFIKYVKTKDLEEYMLDKVEQYTSERKKFYQKYPYEELENLTLEQWAKGDKGEYFSNYLERRTHFSGSGHLGTSKNKIFYYTNNEYRVDDKVQDFYESQGIIEIEEQFIQFKKQILKLINTPIAQIKDFEFQELKGKNVISSKLYNLYAKTPTLSLNGAGYTKKVGKYFGIVLKDKESLQIAYEVEQKLRKFELLKTMDLLLLHRLINKYIDELEETGKL
ncbi:MAG: hypothetical protein ACK5HR_02790 [Mycoplasmatales bacterium]